MPGIVALITSMPRREAEFQLMKMLGALNSEPSYKTGAWIDQESGVYIGWTARSDGLSDEMPLRNERKDVALVFSGEEFPEPGTAQRLRAQGHQCELDGASYLVHLYEDDPLFPLSLNGRFHGIVVDRNRGTAMFFNDRFGMHRIYYHESGGSFYFAAEAKAILAVRPELRKLDLRSVGEFVSCGAVLENRTLFDGISVLPPGSSWSFRNRTLECKKCYFHASQWEDQETLDSEAYYKELRTTFERNLPRYFAGHEPIAMSLTGGLDTRMIMAWQKCAPGSLPCYTFGSMFRENHDVRVARRVAEICKQPHQVITAGTEFLSRFAHYAERAVYLTDACVDVSRAPDLYLNECARKIAPVRLTGNYGGEILRRVLAFKPVSPAAGLFCPEFFSHVSRAAETYTEIVRGHPVSFAAFRQAPWYLHGVLALEQTQLTMRSPYLDNDFLGTVFRSPRSALASNDPSMRLVADGDKALLRIPTDRGLACSRGRTLGGISRGLLEVQFKAEYRFDLGMPHWLARLDHALEPIHLDKAFLGRHKPFHFRVWYRDALAGYVQAILLDARTLSRPYINSKKLEFIVRSHVSGKRNFTTELHKLLTLELLHRLFLDNPATEVDKLPLSLSAATAALAS